MATKMKEMLYEERFCEVCGSNGADFHHIQTVGAGGSDDDSNGIFLCRSDHSRVHACGWETFIKEHPHTEYILNGKGYELKQIFGRMRLCKK